MVQWDSIPTKDKPLLIGLLVDVSASMMSSINNNQGHNVNRLQSFRSSFEELVSKAHGLSQEEASKQVTPLMKLFAFGFGFGNPLSFLFGSSPKVRDLLAIPGKTSTTITIDELSRDWGIYRNHVEGLVTQMFGDTPMYEALQIAKQRLQDEMHSNAHWGQPVLFVLSDGSPTDSSDDNVLQISNEIKSNGILIISCFVTDEDVTEPRRIYGKYSPSWSAAAQLMFNCASEIPNNSPFHAYLSEYKWMVEDSGKLFTQVNQSEVLTEFMNMVVSPLQGSLNTSTTLVSESQVQRNSVFISYSHKDRIWLDRLRVHLKPFERTGKLDIWSDTDIPPGSDWFSEITAALATAKVAILLITADFLASDFIHNEELPALLKAAESNGATIIPVIIKPSLFEEITEISRYQSVNSPSEPLISLPEDKQEMILVKLSQSIKSHLDM